ncbi:glycosyltransferase family 2 protein [Bradyrhizobium sp. 183]|uniref:glycosyltransferase family 2 protein n=1 Tax=unclassified Bradyrhizobium TaxID=2631580 RepID=UPI001FFE8902|nr:MULTISPECIES: glycosyltransferase family 2 protein [unclassified Bradyrhizobium]UPJ78939.1 glycosyltransferase family 2 protein [Bradyrhizobium sp. 184]UPJ86732.1 glycosyltransferase family 2 protein [Bradyrhizobium sp. 183]
MLDLAVVILTHNESIHISRAIESVRPIAKEIFVVDSYSTDETREIAVAAGAVVLQNKFVNYAKQFDWALTNAPITTSWIMRLDADEVVEKDLVAEIQEKLPLLPPDVVGINLNRKHIFMGSWVRHGGRFPLILLRIWRRGHGRIEQRWMDEHMIVWGGRTATFQGGFSDANLNDLTFFTDKHNRYATREAIDVLIRKYRLRPIDEDLSADSASYQAAWKRWIKEGIYNRLPFWMGPLFYFVYRYTIQLGFLDGTSGLIYHVLQGFWYRFLVGAKMEEFDAKLRTCKDNSERVTELERLTSYRL